ncbi:TRAP transporter small permease [Sinisalibacter aestuarii]|uniref:TRAP transporter small permease protein n=1 Tax=Sinisalibacter aestuarii TaxID=2949426 RepID=A0ABQ5LQT7_9RHOB|nr:TRAP transporter small permease [Sinisalibacter aestuarii]GKY86631.1 hypothetical protein STA1M1_05000 [Sinisalibacter aestuarii]
MRFTSIPAWSNLFGRATLVLAWVAGAFLLFMMALIASAVIMRYVVGQPILGVNEIVQLTAVAIAMLALPYATHESIHVRADLFDPALGRWGRFIGDIITRILSIVTLWYLVGRAWAKALDAHEFGDSTNMLNMPIWPFYGLLTLGMALCIVIFALQLATVITTGRPFGERKND